MSDALYLLDSNICIYVLEGQHPALRARIEAFSPGEVVTSSIACAEIMRGIPTDDERRNLRAARFFDIVPVLPFDRNTAFSYRRLPFRRGRFDDLIAAHALLLGLTLVTNNVADFADIPNLKVENWTRP